MKFNKKGQGALEYLLLIGGAVLIAVIVIALLVGMGSSSRANTEKNANDLTGAEAVVPAYITSAYCTTDGNFYITLSALDIARYDYNLMVGGTSKGDVNANPQTLGTGCGDGNVLTIMTKSTASGGIAVSNEFTIRD